MPLVANPLRAPSAYDKLNIAGVDNPGLFQLAGGGGRLYKWEVKDPSGGQGGFVTYRGWELSQGIKAKFVFWEAEQIDQFYESYLPLLQYDATKQAPKPVTVFHPVLDANNIQSIVVNEIGPLTHEDKQLWSVTIDMTEYGPPPKKNATSTPKGADAAGKASATKPSAQDAQDLEIQKLVEEANKPLAT
jgi:hypothetical protein